MITTGSSPTTHASWPAGSAVTWPGVASNSAPSLVRTRRVPAAWYWKCGASHHSVPAIGRTSVDQRQPGWRWSTDVKPIAGTEWCEAPHFQYHVAGVLRVRTSGGEEFDARTGQVTTLPSGHDAWVVGDEPVVVVDWWGASHYARGA